MPCSIARLQHSAAHRHARHVLAVSRHRGRADARRGQLHRLSARAFSALGQGYLWGVVPDAAACCSLPILVALRRPAASIGRRARVVRHRIQRRPARATRGCRSSGGSASLYLLSGLDLERRGDRLRRAPRSGEVGRGLRIRARCDHGRRPRRHVRVRRARARCGAPCSGCSRLSVLRNGLHLAALPSELTGVLTGTLLVATIAIDRSCAAVPAAPVARMRQEEEIPVKNSQVAVLCGAIVAGSLIVAGTNVWLVRSLGSAAPAAAAAPVVARRRPRDGRSSR